MKNISVSFLEREFFAEDRTKTTIRGYEPAVMIYQGKPEFGRVINPNEMHKANFIDTICFQTQFPLCDSEIDLVPILESDEHGALWLQAYQRYHSETYGENVPMKFLIQILDLVPGWVYYLVPGDYLKRIGGGRRYLPPKAVMDHLPNGTFYCKIHPIPNSYCNKNVRGSKKVFASYHISDPSDDKYSQVGGVLLGTLNQTDLKNPLGDFEDDFPLNHFLEVVYFVSLRQAGKYNLLKIKVELAD